MEVLITGANGFLGYYLTEQLLVSNHRVLATGRGKCRLPFSSHEKFQYVSMDFTLPETVWPVFEKNKPDVLVHAGAMSKPDDCELQQALAYKINVEGTINLLQAAEKQRCFFIFVSTDFIFDGVRGMYREEDEPGPVNYYGATKLLAEKEVNRYPHEWSIVRTVLLYGKPVTGRGNILSITKGKLAKGEEYSVVDDQLRTPTYVGDFAKGILSVIEKKATGIFHLSGPGVLTPYQMVCKTAQYLRFDSSLIKKVTAANFTEPARRPLKTGFIIDKAKKELGYDPLSFDEGLIKTFS
ncbi:MAG: SDR family oxidoreductase [Bacteroidota bacterium]